MTEREFGTLAAALAAYDIPIANHALIRMVTEAIGITAYQARSGYIKADRMDGHPALQIYSGYTNGFRGRDEIEAAAGDLLPLLGPKDVWRSHRAAGMWGMNHPENSMGKLSRTKSGSQSADYGTCDKCYQRRAANGACLCDA